MLQFHVSNVFTGLVPLFRRVHSHTQALNSRLGGQVVKEQSERQGGEHHQKSVWERWLKFRILLSPGDLASEIVLVVGVNPSSQFSTYS